MGGKEAGSTVLETLGQRMRAKAPHRCSYILLSEVVRSEAATEVSALFDGLAEEMPPSSACFGRTTLITPPHSATGPGFILGARREARGVATWASNRAASTQGPRRRHFRCQQHTAKPHMPAAATCRHYLRHRRQSGRPVASLRSLGPSMQTTAAAVSAGFEPGFRRASLFGQM